MTEVLRRAMVCSPRSAGWDTPEQIGRWKELGFLHPPAFSAAQAQHEELCRHLQVAGVELVELPPSSAFTLDAVYTHDPSLATDFGVILMNPGKPNRVPEAAAHGDRFCALNIPILGQIAAPGTTEAGDIVWLDTKTLLVGHGYRTNADGIAQMRDLLSPKGVEVLDAPLPYGTGPSACLHLMSLISLLEDKVMLVDLAWLAVETVELLLAREFHFIEIEPGERDTLACNVLALGDRRLLAIEENHKTNAKLRQSGFDVRTFSGSELCVNGGGGPTCLTRPLLRT
jgi:N-dimethylarginine dimethylaminohydrolase